MSKKSTHTEFESSFRLFVNKHLDRKFGARLVRRGAACQEFVKFQADIAGDTPADKAEVVAVWNGMDGNARIRQIDFAITGKDTIELDAAPGSLLTGDLASCTYRLPIALCAEPRQAILDIAKCAVPEWTDAYSAAGMLQGQRIILAKAVSQQIEVPASCKMVFEGYIEKKDSQTAGCKLTMHVSCVTGQIG